MSQTSANQKRSGAFDIESAPGALIGAGQAVALASCCLAPWLFGCIRFREAQWFYFGLLSSLVLATLVVVIRAVRTPNSSSLRVPFLAVPIFLGLAIGVLQLMPIQQSLTGSRVKQVPELAEKDLGSGITSERLSFHPTATRLELSRYGFAAAAFLIGYCLFRTPRAQRLLWAVLLVNGVALVVFGLVQRFTWNDQLFWTVPLPNGGDPFASFVNRNNAVAFLHVSGACAIGLLVWAFEREPIRATQGPVEAFMARLAALSSLQLTLIVCLGLLVGGAVASTSRGGALSFGVACFSSLIFVSGKRKSIWPLMLAGLTAAVVGLLVLTLEVDEGLKERVAKIDTTDVLENKTRLPHWRDALKVAKTLPVYGSGLGTHRYAYLPFVTSFGRSWSVYADGQYVELAIEAGIIGLVWLGLFIGFVGRLFWVGRGSSSEIAGTSVALLFLLCSQMVHALFDFGIILPATLCSCGVLLGAAAATISPRTGGRGATFWAGRLALPAIALSVIGFAGFGFMATRKAATTEVMLAKRPADLSNEELATAIQGVASLPSGEARRHHGFLLIERFERQALIEIGEMSPEMDPRLIENLASLDGLYISVQRLKAVGQVSQLQPTLASKAVVDNLPLALAKLNDAVRECPILPNTSGTIGKLRGVLDESSPIADLERAVLLEPYQDKIVAEVGCDLLELPLGQELGESVVRHALTTSRWRVRSELVDELERRFGIVRVAGRVCPRNATGTVAFVEALNRSGHKAIARNILQAVVATESSEVDLPSMLARAEMCRILGNDKRMIEVLESAAASHGGSAEPHFLLAQALQRQGELSAALREARIASAIEPEDEAYAELLEDLELKARSARSGANLRSSLGFHLMTYTGIAQCRKRWS